MSGRYSGGRGAPLAFLLTILGAWTFARLVTVWPWSPANAETIPVEPTPSFGREGAQFLAASQSDQGKPLTIEARNSNLAAMARQSFNAAAEKLTPTIDVKIAGAAAILPSASPQAGAFAFSPVRRPAMVAEPTQMLTKSQLNPHEPSRWSAYGWLLLRQDKSTTLAAAQPSYGRSQIGAVLRYRLAGGGHHQLQAYIRGSAALAGTREQEVAVGLSARPIAGLPVRFAAEARVSETASRTEVRPAAYAVTEFPPLALPLGARAEAYAQVGYVAGSFATAFIDGQLRAERPLARLGAIELAAGGGVWGGAQRGTSRLDVGPTAVLRFPLGPATGRLAADYRFRVAGDAAPASGPALTLSAGF